MSHFHYLKKKRSKVFKVALGTLPYQLLPQCFIYSLFEQPKVGQAVGDNLGLDTQLPGLSGNNSTGWKWHPNTETSSKSAQFPKPKPGQIRPVHLAVSDWKLLKLPASTSSLLAPPPNPISLLHLGKDPRKDALSPHPLLHLLITPFWPDDVIAQGSLSVFSQWQGRLGTF